MDTGSVLMAAATAIELSDGMTASSDAKADERALVIAAQRGSGETVSALRVFGQRRIFATSDTRAIRDRS